MQLRIAIASGLENTSALLDALEVGRSELRLRRDRGLPGRLRGRRRPADGAFNQELARSVPQCSTRPAGADVLRYSHENPDIGALRETLPGVRFPRKPRSCSTPIETRGISRCLAIDRTARSMRAPRSSSTKLCRTRSLSLGEYRRLVTAAARRGPVSLRVAPMPCAGRYTARRCLPAGSSRCRAFAERLPVLWHPPVGHQRRAATAFLPTRLSNVRTLVTTWGFARSFAGWEDPFFTDDVLTCGIIRPGSGAPRLRGHIVVRRTSRQKLQAPAWGGRRTLPASPRDGKACALQALAPPEMSLGNRMRCLSDLRNRIRGGAGFMVGAPFQTAPTLRATCSSSNSSSPRCAVSARLSHHATPFSAFAPRHQRNSRAICCPMRPAHQARCAASRDHGARHVVPDGRERITCRANVVMPNLSPVNRRKDYDLYDNKICTGEGLRNVAAAWARACCRSAELVVDRGDLAPLPET